MPPQVKEDLQRGHAVTRNSWRIFVQRTFHVTQLDAAPEHMLMQALDQTGIPDYLDPYPFNVVPEYPEYENIKVLERRCEPTGPDTAIIVITYTNDFSTVSTSKPTTNDGPEEKQIRYSVAEQTTTVDRTSADMVLAPPASRASWPSVKSEAYVARPIGVLTFERTELTAPTQRMRDLVGKLNDGAEGPYGDETLLFSNLDATGNAEDGWQCTYEFSYNPAGWKHKDRYKSPTDNRIPDDAIEVEWDVLEKADFGPLGFDWTD